MLLNKLI